MRKPKLTTGNRAGDWLLLIIFLLVAGVGILTTTFLFKFDSGRTNLITEEVDVKEVQGESIVVLGDSLAQGVGATSSEKTLAAQIFASRKGAFPNATLWNFGLAGATVANVVGDQSQRLAAVKPAEIYLIIGANDVTKQTPVESFAESYRNLLATLTGTGAKVVVVTIPKLAATPAVPEAQKVAADTRTKLLNEKILAAAAEYPGKVRVVDGYAFSERELQPGSDFLADDQFHPNDDGYAKLAAEVVQ
ncbi:hypothetical protein BH11PAT4_BH11PAT4_6400 [soil metagenome]